MDVGGITLDMLCVKSVEDVEDAEDIEDIRAADMRATILDIVAVKGVEDEEIVSFVLGLDVAELKPPLEVVDELELEEANFLFALKLKVVGLILGEEVVDDDDNVDDVDREFCITEDEEDKIEDLEDVDDFDIVVMRATALDLVSVKGVEDDEDEEELDEDLELKVGIDIKDEDDEELGRRLKVEVEDFEDVDAPLGILCIKDIEDDDALDVEVVPPGVICVEAVIEDVDDEKDEELVVLGPSPSIQPGAASFDAYSLEETLYNPHKARLGLYTKATQAAPFENVVLSQIEAQ